MNLASLSASAGIGSSSPVTLAGKKKEGNLAATASDLGAIPLLAWWEAACLRLTAVFSDRLEVFK